MATIDITPNMLPSEYGEADQWKSAGQFNSHKLVAGDWIELRCHSRYTRRQERFSVLYQGPAGTMRLEHGQAPEPGPVGCLIPQCSVIANTPVARARIIDVKVGDVLVINGQRMVIIDDNPMDYPRLVCEAEAGLAYAIGLLRARANRMVVERRDETDAAAGAALDAQIGLLRDMVMDVRKVAPEVRQAYAAPATR